MDPTPVTPDILTPFFQYGFAGVALILFGFLFWFIKQYIKSNSSNSDALIALERKSFEVVGKNTEAIQHLCEVNKEERDELRNLNLELRGRPCLQKKY